jgi:hypothetical protein
MPRCKNCGAHVTTQFARVFGDNEDTVHHCIGCVPNGDLEENNVESTEPQSATGVWDG